MYYNTIETTFKTESNKLLDLTPAAGDGQDALFPQPTLHLKYHHVNIIFWNPYSAMAFAGAG